MTLITFDFHNTLASCDRWFQLEITLLASEVYTALRSEHTPADRIIPGDVLIRAIELPHAELGEIVAVATAGAYTLSMASNYNLTPRPALLLVADGHARVIQRRETYADLVARDQALG